MTTEPKETLEPLSADLAHAADAVGWLLLRGEQLCAQFAETAGAAAADDYASFFTGLRDNFVRWNEDTARHLPPQDDGRRHPPWR